MPKNASITKNRITASFNKDNFTDMSGTNKRFRTYLALVLLSGLIVLFAMAGTWQLNRAKQRDAIALHINQAANQPPVIINGDTQSEQHLWRSASAQGQWLHQFTVLLDNRNYKGRPGYWVATPFLLGNTAIIVLRGWLPRTQATLEAINNELITTSDPVTIEGRLIPRVPRALELWSVSGQSTSDQPLTLQNLDINDFASKTGLKLLGMVLEQNNQPSSNATSDTPFAVNLIQDWPNPASGADTNRGYALQWFSFCAIACSAWIFMARRVIQKKY